MQSILKNLTEQKAPAAQIDLWPAIQSRIQMSQPTQSGMNTHSNSKLWPLKTAFILLTVILIGALILFLPQGRALAQEVLHFFYRGESNFMPGPTSMPLKWVEQTPGTAAGNLTLQPATPQPTPPGQGFEKYCGTANDPQCSVEAIREAVTFPVFALAKLPDGMYFAGATGSPDRVFLMYNTPNQAGTLLVYEEPFSGAESQLAWDVGADADIQSVQVGTVTAEYVKGWYDGNSNPPVWNNNSGGQMLRWVDQGILFNIYMIGTEPHLNRDELAALAATLTNGPVGLNGIPAVVTATPTQAAVQTIELHTIYPLTLAEAEKKVGTALLSPSLLPETLSFIGANYDEKTRVVEIIYIYIDPKQDPAISNPDSLLIKEQVVPEGSDCDLCGFLQGDGKQAKQDPLKLVSKDATIETVQIGDFTGKYVEGIGWRSWTDCCGFEWDPTPYRKRLRFRTNELAIEVWYDGFTLTKADIIAIAESLE
ncbi:MAG: hypothetical protein CVU39_18900 [Chloroflexi bacterium HGW-Chloroflexi-10]|nr:MAG: hypothetical protein CVU39_18900 [Chloroflexi bacterium HGW-Chloroflexi-10]